MCYTLRCLVNFKDKFVYLITANGPYRYSLAEDKWEELPWWSMDGFPSACSLGDKVYVLYHVSRTIQVLHNPGAPVFSQEMRWETIYAPKDVPIPGYSPAFAPLNSTEIVIAGGVSKDRTTVVGNIVTFNATTCEFNVASRDTFECQDNKSANVCEDIIVAIV